MNLASVIVFATWLTLRLDLANLPARSIGAYVSRGQCHTLALSGPYPSRFLGVTLPSTSTMTSGTKQHPLFGFLPRNVTAKQVKGVMVRCVLLLCV